MDRISNININTNNQRKYNNVSFKNGAGLTPVLGFMQTNGFWGPAAIDFTCMTVPRTSIDMTRNPYAGLETLRREMTGVLNHAFIGLYGLGAAALLSKFSTKYKGVDYKSINADNKTVDALSNAFTESCKKHKNLEDIQIQKAIVKDFLQKVFKKVEGLSGNSEIDKNSSDLWKQLQNNSHIVDEMQDAIFNNSVKTGTLPKKINDKLIFQLVKDTGVAGELRAEIAGKKIHTEAKYLFNDVFNLTRAFLHKNVVNTFKESVDDNKFVKHLKNFGSKRTLIGLAVGATIGLSAQAINRYITKKKTGSDGFVGDPNYSRDHVQPDKPVEKTKKSSGFKLAKLLSVTAMGGLILYSLGGKISQIPKKIQFKGKLPTVDQLKVVYGATLIGRLFAANDKNELRETATRDFLGFTNWLILGGVVSKLYISAKDKVLAAKFGEKYKSIINYDPKEHGKGFFNWLTKSSTKTQEDIIYRNTKCAFDKAGNKRPLNQLINKLDDVFQTQLKVVNKGQLLGYLYSAAVLGLGIPLLNKYITERKAKDLQKASDLNTEQALSYQNIININSNNCDNKTKNIYQAFLG